MFGLWSSRTGHLRSEGLFQKVLKSDMGDNYMDHFESFDQQPFAAASIGQVHSAILKGTKEKVAIKIQVSTTSTHSTSGQLT